MTTSRVFNHGRVLWQSSGNDDELPNEAIAVHIDNGGTLCLNQGGNCIVINRETLKQLCDTMKAVVGDYDKSKSKRS